MILQSLKSRTAHSHQNVEANLSKKLLISALLPNDYHQLLTAFYTSYHALEHAVNSQQNLAPLLKERSKLPLLQRDLHHMHQLLNKAPDHLPWHPLPEIDSEAMALGTMYVMEGATLGGKQIVNYLKRIDWVDPPTCLNFFNSYGSERARMWKSFTHYLETYAERHPSQHDLVIRGAKLAFDHIDDAITRSTAGAIK